MGRNRRFSIDVSALPLWGAVLPLFTINICYLIAIGLNHLPACFPYISGCTSVSSTGRTAPESLVFRAGMLPTALILVFIWHRCATFLGLGGQSGARLAALRVSGIIAAMSLVIYAVTLGFEDEGYRQLRRVGIVGFAASTVVTDVLMIALYRPMRISTTKSLWRWLVIFCVALPLFDIASEVAKWAGVPRRPANNVVAWNAFVMVSAYYVVVGRIWWHHGFIGEFRLKTKRTIQSRS